MTYDPRPAASNDTLVSSRDAIRTNFNLLRTNIEANHLSVNGLGKHKFMQMPDQGSDPATAANEGALFVKLGTGPAESNLWYRSDDSAGTGGQLYQLTRVDEAEYAKFGTNTIYQAAAAGVPELKGGWTFLPGGVIYNYGTIVIAFPGNLAASRTVIFPKAYASAADVYVVMNNASSNPSSITATNFVCGSSTTGASISWFAVGK